MDTSAKARASVSTGVRSADPATRCAHRHGSRWVGGHACARRCRVGGVRVLSLPPTERQSDRRRSVLPGEACGRWRLQKRRDACRDGPPPACEHACLDNPSRGASPAPCTPKSGQETRLSAVKRGDACRYRPPPLPARTNGVTGAAWLHRPCEPMVSVNVLERTTQETGRERTPTRFRETGRRCGPPTQARKQMRSANLIREHCKGRIAHLQKLAVAGWLQSIKCLRGPMEWLRIG